MIRKRKNEKRKTENRENWYFVFFMLWNGKRCLAMAVAE